MHRHTEWSRCVRIESHHTAPHMLSCVRSSPCSFHTQLFCCSFSTIWRVYLHFLFRIFWKLYPPAMFMAVCVAVVSARVLTLVIYFVISLAIYYLASQQISASFNRKIVRIVRWIRIVQECGFCFLRCKPKIKRRKKQQQQQQQAIEKWNCSESEMIYVGRWNCTKKNGSRTIKNNAQMKNGIVQKEQPIRYEWKRLFMSSCARQCLLFFLAVWKFSQSHTHPASSEWTW